MVGGSGRVSPQTVTVPSDALNRDAIYYLWWVHVPSTPVTRRLKQGPAEPVTWLELFFDLVFVGILASVAERFHPNETPLAAAESIALLYGVLTVWLVVTLVFSRYPADVESVEKPWVEWRATRLLLTVFLMCTLLTGISLLLDDIDKKTSGAGYFWVGVSLVALASLFFVEHSTPPESPMLKEKLPGLLVLAASGIAFVIDAYSPTPHVWHIVAIFFPLVLAVMVLNENRDGPRHLRHLTERFGLLNLIAMGAIFLPLAVNIADKTDANVWPIYAVGLLFPVAIFVMYFGIGAPIGEVEPRVRVWIPLEATFAITVLVTGNAFVYRAIDQGYNLVKGHVGLLLGVLLLVMCGLCYFGNRVRLPITIAYGVCGLALLTATALAYAVSLKPTFVTLALGSCFILVAVVVTGLAVRYPASTASVAPTPPQR
ncbi:MAG: low temperature requirement protein LtrA [Actinomycetes bacterium]|jgi:low temperature requirement protein LtrA